MSHYYYHYYFLLTTASKKMLCVLRDLHSVSNVPYRVSCLLVGQLPLTRNPSKFNFVWFTVVTTDVITAF